MTGQIPIVGVFVYGGIMLWNGDAAAEVHKSSINFLKFASAAQRKPLGGFPEK